MSAARTRTAAEGLQPRDGQTEIHVREFVPSSMPAATDTRHRVDRVLDVLTHWSGILLGMAVGAVLALGALR